MSTVLVKQIPIILSFFVFWSCQKKPEDFPVLEDLGIALQTMRHQLDEVALRPSTNSANQSIKPETQTIEVSAAEIEFENKTLCSAEKGSFTVTLKNKMTQNNESFFAEYVAKNKIRLTRQKAPNNSKIFDVSDYCSASK